MCDLRPQGPGHDGTSHVEQVKGLDIDIDSSFRFGLTMTMIEALAWKCAGLFSGWKEDMHRARCGAAVLFTDMRARIEDADDLKTEGALCMHHPSDFILYQVLFFM